jgi:hypothetical protein
VRRIASLALLHFGISADLSPLQPATPRNPRIAVLCVLLLTAGFLLANQASAQSACAQLGVDCTYHDETRPSGDSSSDSQRSDPITVWKARWAAGAEARAQAKAARAARKAAKDAQNQAKRRAKEDAQRQAENVRQNAIAAKQARAADAERQRLLAIEAQRLQAAFDTAKPTLLSGMKGVDGSGPRPKYPGNSLGLKDVDDGRGSAVKPVWNAQITDPQVKKFAKHLGSVVPPLPIPKEEVALDWKKIYLNDDRLLNTSNYVVAAWEMAGLIGKANVGVKLLLIGGKTLIAGENGAYIYLVKKDQDYDAALGYLKNPGQSQQFAHLVQDVRQNRPLPAWADPDMVRAARTITDPKQGDIPAMVWDSMTSREALSAMLRKASIEATSEVVSYGIGTQTKGLFAGEEERKAMFDSVRLERTQARKMMDLPTTTEQQRAQLKVVVDRANQLSADIYKMDKTAKRVTDGVGGLVIGDATDKVATVFLGPEAKGKEY